MELQELFIMIDQLLEKINSIGISQEDEARLWKKFRLEFNYNSNHIEGNTLTYGQTELLLLFDKSTGDVSLSDLEEMKAHDVALSLIVDYAKDKERPLTESFIKELNQLILVRPFWKEAVTADGLPTRKKIEPGQYKTSPNSVRLKNGEIHEYSSPEETPAEMEALIKWYRTNETVLRPVELAAEFHYRFVCIHPFDDGNGRVARLIMNYILLKYDIPPIIVQSSDKENYLTALQKADTKVDRDAVVKYLGEALLWSLNLKLKAAKGEDLYETGDIEKEIELLKREKLTEGVIYKTPKSTYDTVKYFKDKIFPIFNLNLAKFDDFFSFSSNFTYIDGNKVEKIRTIGSFFAFSSLPQRKEVVKEFEIYDIDLTKEQIDKVEWQWNMEGLKSAKKKSDLIVKMELDLKESFYNVTIMIFFPNYPDTIIEIAEKKYNSFYLNADIESLVKKTSEKILQIIKEN